MEIIARCKEALDRGRGKTPARDYLQMAKAQRKMGDFHAAEVVIREAREHHPADASLISEFAKCAIAREDWSEVVARCGYALDVLGKKTPGSIYLMSSIAYRNLGRFDAADAIIRRGRAIFTDDVTLALESAEIALAQNDWAETVARCQSILDSVGDNAAARAIMGIAYYCLGDSTIDEAMARPNWPDAAKRLQAVVEPYGNKLPASFYDHMRSDYRAEANSHAGHDSTTNLADTPDAVFIWIPKTAGTSLYDALAAVGCPKLKTPELAKLAFSGKGVVTFGHMSYKMLIDRGYVSDKFDKDSMKFTFVRNPFSRAVSLYYYVQRYITTYNRKPTFLEFLELLDTGLYDSVGLYNVKNLSQCNPQARWLEGLTLAFIGKVENITLDYASLQATLKIKLPNLGKSKKGLYNEDISFGKREKYLVEKIYDEDFATFGYSKTGTDCH